MGNVSFREHLNLCSEPEDMKSIIRENSFFFLFFSRAHDEINSSFFLSLRSPEKLPCWLIFPSYAHEQQIIWH